MSEDYRRYLRMNQLPHLWCSGCGDGVIVKALFETIGELRLDQDRVVVVSGIGCSGRMPFMLDFDTIHESVRKTGRCVVVHEAQATAGFGAEIAALVQEALFRCLRAPVLRVTGFDTPYPPAKLEHFWLPDPDRILDAIARSLAY